MHRFTAVFVASALVLAPAFAEAAAKVKSHSNTNNNRFSQQCTSLGGKTADGPDGPTCTLPPPPSGKPTMAVKGSGVPKNLSDACTQDGGKIVEQGGGFVCKASKP